MQTILDLCDVFSADFDVKFNTAKTVAMRIGPRFDVVCADLTLSGGIIQYVQSLKYLGGCIKANRTFVCNFDHVKAKFYRTMYLCKKFCSEFRIDYHRIAAVVAYLFCCMQ